MGTITRNQDSAMTSTIHINMSMEHRQSSEARLTPQRHHYPTQSYPTNPTKEFIAMEGYRSVPVPGRLTDFLTVPEAFLAVFLDLKSPPCLATTTLCMMFLDLIW